MKLCKVQECDNKHVARGYCRYHYDRRRTVGDKGLENYSGGAWSKGREIPADEPGLVTHTPAGTIIRHGGAGTGYAHWGCRCKACCEANTLRTGRRRKERSSGEIPNNVVHGKSATYSNWSCRCDECTVAWAQKMKEQYWKRKSKGAK